jgi:pyruvate formate-lyase activating enzyme-like uncharacterized protein
MARGTVKDPTGHQSKPHDFGYIQRDKSENNKDLVWPLPDNPANDNYKAIPFKNEEPDGTRYNEGDPVDFKSRTAHVVYLTKKELDDFHKHFPDKYLGTIGIALTKEQLKAIGEPWP